MFFDRAEARELIRESIARSLITILISNAGCGKSRLIDSLFEFDGDFDTNHVEMIRLDERVHDCDSLAHCFAKALNHDLPDDSDYSEFIVAAIKKLDPYKIIVVDNLHFISNNLEALNFVHQIINTSGIYENVPRRWLLASRDINDFPHNNWIPDRKCRIISDELKLKKAEKNAFSLFLKIEADKITTESPRQLMISYGANRALRELPDRFRSKTKVKFRAHRYVRNSNAVRKFLSCLSPEIASSILASSIVYDLNPDFLIDHLPLILDVIDILRSLDLAFFDLAQKTIQIDSHFRNSLQNLIPSAPTDALYTAAKIACELGCEGAFLKCALMGLIRQEQWTSLITLLGEYGIDLIDRHDSQKIISDVIRYIPKALADPSPEIQGLKGLLTTIGDQGDTSEGWLVCALENEAVKEPFRSKILYRYCIELRRRDREDTKVRLNELMQSIYQHNSGGDALKALAHSSYANAYLDENPAMAIGHINQAKKHLEDTNDPYAHARVSFEIAYALDDLNERLSAIPYLEKCVDISKRNGFFDLAARAMSNLQAIAYIEHEIPLAIHYIRCQGKYAEKTGDTRMKTCAWLSGYALTVEAGINDDIAKQYDGISRYRATDKFMQEQVRRTIIPATAMLSAQEADYTNAISRIETYAILEEDLIDRAVAWSFLTLYYAADYVMQPNRLKLKNYSKSIREMRKIMQSMNEDAEQESETIFRVLLSLYLMERHDFLRAALPRFTSLVKHDFRIPAMTRMLKALLNFNIHEIDNALNGLDDLYMGGIAHVIRFLPLPISLQINLPTPKPANPYAEV